MHTIVNVGSGSAAAITELLDDLGGFDVHRCTGAEVARAVRDAVREGHRRIVVAGGDGTIAAAAGVVAESAVELAVIPAGTLNHFAREHGIPGAPADAALLARDGSSVYVDVGRVNDRVFLNTSSAGAYVTLVRMRERLEPDFGYSLGTLAAAVRTLATMERFAVRVETPEGARLYRTPLLFVGVGERELKLPLLGSRVPGGRAGLHVMIVRGRTRSAVLALALQAAMRGTEAAMATPHLDSFLLDECEVTLRSRTRVATDGEVVKLASPLRYRLVRAGLRLVKP